jgi:hypothetical protein
MATKWHDAYMTHVKEAEKGDTCGPPLASLADQIWECHINGAPYTATCNHARAMYALLLRGCKKSD